VASAEAVVSDCDALYVCTWTAAHEDAVAHAASAGIPVFCEKPLSTDLAGAQRMTTMVNDAGVGNQVGLVLRSLQGVTAFREMVHDPANGEIVSVVFRDDQFLPNQGHYASTWRTDPARAGAGVLIEHSIHDLDLIEWVIGPVGRVSASSGNTHGIDGIEDAMHVLFDAETPNGSVAGLLATVWHDMLDRPSQRRIEVFCEHALVVLEGEWSGPVRRTFGGETLEMADATSLAAYLAERNAAPLQEDARFVAAVQGQADFWPTFDVALRAHEVCDAVYRAASTGSAVHI
jgi:predicted dehydrogenase